MRDAGVAEHGVDPPARRLGESFERAVPVFPAAHIEAAGKAGGRWQQGSGFGHAGIVDVAQPDKPAARAEQLRRRPANSRSAAGDEDRFRLGHVFLRLQCRLCSKPGA